jgi:hypothetical protein
MLKQDKLARLFVEVCGFEFLIGLCLPWDKIQVIEFGIEAEALTFNLVSSGLIT